MPVLRAQVAEVDGARFQGIAGEAAQLCPVSRLCARARINVQAHLEPS